VNGPSPLERARVERAAHDNRHRAVRACARMSSRVQVCARGPRRDGPVPTCGRDGRRHTRVDRNDPAVAVLSRASPRSPTLPARPCKTSLRWNALGRGGPGVGVRDAEASVTEDSLVVGQSLAQLGDEPIEFRYAALDVVGPKKVPCKEGRVTKGRERISLGSKCRVATAREVDHAPVPGRLDDDS